MVQATNTGGDLGSNQFDLAVSFPSLSIFLQQYLNDMLMGSRSPEAVSASSTAAQPNGVRLQQAGAHNTAVSLHALNATPSQQLSKLVVISDTTGS